MRLPEGEEADPLFLYTTSTVGGPNGGDFVRLGDLTITTSDDVLDGRISISLKVQTNVDLDFSDGFLRDLSLFLLHRRVP